MNGLRQCLLTKRGGTVSVKEWGPWNVDGIQQESIVGKTICIKCYLEIHHSSLWDWNAQTSEERKDLWPPKGCNWHGRESGSDSQSKPSGEFCVWSPSSSISSRASRKCSDGISKDRFPRKCSHAGNTNQILGLAVEFRYSQEMSYTSCWLWCQNSMSLPFTGWWSCFCLIEIMGVCTWHLCCFMSTMHLNSCTLP